MYSSMEDNGVEEDMDFLVKNKKTGQMTKYYVSIEEFNRDFIVKC